MRFNIILFSCCFFLFSACEQEEGQFTIIEGFVTNSVGTPLTEAEISINHFTSLWYLGLGGSSTNLANIAVDSTGFYSFAFFNESSSNHSARVRVSDNVGCSNGTKVELGQKNTINFQSAQLRQTFKYIVTTTENTSLASEVRFQYDNFTRPCEKNESEQVMDYIEINENSRAFYFKVPHLDSIDLKMYIFDNQGLIGRDSLLVTIPRDTLTRSIIL